MPVCENTEHLVRVAHVLSAYRTYCLRIARIVYVSSMYRPCIDLYWLCIGCVSRMYCSLAASEVVWVGVTIKDVGRVRVHLDPAHAVLDAHAFSQL